MRYVNWEVTNFAYIFTPFFAGIFILIREYMGGFKNSEDVKLMMVVIIASRFFELVNFKLFLRRTIPAKYQYIIAVAQISVSIVLVILFYKYKLNEIGQTLVLVRSFIITEITMQFIGKLYFVVSIRKVIQQIHEFESIDKIIPTSSEDSSSSDLKAKLANEIKKKV